MPRASEHVRLRTFAEVAAAWTEVIAGSPERALEHADLALALEGDWPSMTHFQSATQELYGARDPLRSSCFKRAFAICGFSAVHGMSAWALTVTRCGVGVGCAGGRLGVVEEVPDLSGDVAFEAADRFAFGLAF